MAIEDLQSRQIQLTDLTITEPVATPDSLFDPKRDFFLKYRKEINDWFKNINSSNHRLLPRYYALKSLARLFNAEGFIETKEREDECGNLLSAWSVSKRGDSWGSIALPEDLFFLQTLYPQEFNKAYQDKFKFIEDIANFRARIFLEGRSETGLMEHHDSLFGIYTALMMVSVKYGEPITTPQDVIDLAREEVSKDSRQDHSYMTAAALLKIDDPLKYGSLSMNKSLWRFMKEQGLKLELKDVSEHSIMYGDDLRNFLTSMAILGAKEIKLNPGEVKFVFSEEPAAPALPEKRKYS